MNTSLLKYGFIALPMAFAGLPLYIYAPDYYTTEFSISLTTMALLLFALRLIDAFQEPALGYISDKFHHQRMRFVPASLAIMVIAFFSLFCPPSTYTEAWFFVTMFIATTAYSLLSINLNSIGGLLKGNKIKIAGHREAFGVVGLFIAVISPAILMQSFDKVVSFFLFGAILSIFALIALSFWLSFANTKPELDPKSLKIKTKLKSKTRFLVGYFISTLGSAYAAVLVLFYIRDYLNLENYTGLFLAAYFGSTLLSIPFWTKASQNKEIINWRRAIFISCFIFAIAFAALEPGNMTGYLLLCLITGSMLGAELILPPAHMAKTLPESSASRFYAAMSFLNKTALAVASLTAFYILDTQGFIAAQENSTQAQQTLHILYAGVPVVFKMVAWHILRKEKS